MPIKLFIRSVVFISLIIALTYLVLPGESQTNNDTPVFEITRNPDHPYGGTLVWGTINKPTIINPILTQHTVSASLMELVFDSLVRIDSEGSVVPGLAASWDVSKNRLEYIFYLRKNVRFHDGTEFTADDVKFTYEAINDPNNQSPWRTNTELVKEWKVVDPYTLKLVLREPFAPILSKLVREIVPKHLLLGEDLSNTAFNHKPVGTGPFILEDWQQATGQITLKANLEYFGGRPYLDRIVIKTYPSNDHLWSALMRHEVDMVLYISHADFLVVKKDSFFSAHAIPWKMYAAVLYNPKDPILFDREVRKAIAHSIDKKRLMELTTIDGIESTGPFHPELIGFNPDVEPYEYNPIKAGMILMHRGWKDADGDGILEKAKKDLEINILVDGQSDFYKKMIMIIRQQLAEVGIKVNVQLYADEDELTEEYLLTHKPHAWLRFFAGVGFEGYDASGNWYSLASQSGQLWGYKNEEVDRLFKIARVAELPEQRELTYQKIHRIVYEDQPACFLFYPVSFHAVSSKFKNTEHVFSSHMPGYAIKDWYID